MLSSNSKLGVAHYVSLMMGVLISRYYGQVQTSVMRRVLMFSCASARSLVHS